MTLLQLKLKGIILLQNLENQPRESFLFLYQGLGIDTDKKNTEVLSEIGQYVESQERKTSAKDKAPINYRGDIVKDNYNDINDRFYGNNDLMAGTPEHGTHVSGIIAAARK
jgi:subtilisin family serine protease